MFPYMVLSEAPWSEPWTKHKRDQLAFLFRPNAAPRMLAVQLHTVGIAALRRGGSIFHLANWAPWQRAEHLISGTTSLRRRPGRIHMVAACKLAALFLRPIGNG